MSKEKQRMLEKEDTTLYNGTCMLKGLTHTANLN